MQIRDKAVARNTMSRKDMKMLKCGAWCKSIALRSLTRLRSRLLLRLLTVLPEAAFFAVVSETTVVALMQVPARVECAGACAIEVDAVLLLIGLARKTGLQWSGGAKTITHTTILQP